MKSTQSLLAMAGVVIMTAVAAAGFAIAIYAAWLFHDLPSGHEIADYRPATSTRVFAWDGTLLGEYAKERRVFIPYDRIPKHLSEAFLAAEDRNFFNHSGVDISGIGRALIKDAGNFTKGKRFEGGSTITQQVAKNALLEDNERTISRKLKEIILARRLEASLTKEQILELYLNDIFLGYRSNGVGIAAYNYFGKSVDELSLSEMAYLAALPKGPNNYHPIRFKDKAIARRNWILGEMVKAGWATQAEADKASHDDLVVQNNPERTKYKDADYFVNEVERRSKNILGDDIYSKGFYIKTTLNPKMQTAARIALMQGLENYDRHHGWRGAWGHVTVGEAWVNEANGLYQALPHAKRIPAEHNTWISALVTRASSGNTDIVTMTGERGQLSAADLGWAFAGAGLKAGDLIFAEKKGEGQFSLKQVPLVNGALVALDPWSGKVLAMVGGYSYSLSNFNRATQALRQPGSSIKPFIYASALEKGYTPASTFLDAPLNLIGGDGKAWTPQNYERSFGGLLPMRKGLEQSLNTMTIRIAMAAGVKYVADKVVSYGPYDQLTPMLSFAIGSAETTPFKMTASYAAFPNGGRRIMPHLIDMVQDREGKVVYRADTRDCAVACAQDESMSPRLAAEGKPVMDEITAYQITTFLQGVVQRGTATRALELNRPVAGKTGTTNDYRSAWFMGFTTDIVVGVFVGRDDNISLGEGETGAHAALPIFVDFMKLVDQDLPRKEFPKPANIVMAPVRGIYEAFKVGTEPKYTEATMPLATTPVAPEMTNDDDFKPIEDPKLSTSHPNDQQ